MEIYDDVGSSLWTSWFTEEKPHKMNSLNEIQYKVLAFLSVCHIRMEGFFILYVNSEAEISGFEIHVIIKVNWKVWIAIWIYGFPLKGRRKKWRDFIMVI